MTVSIESPFPVYALPRVWAWAEESRRQVADDFAPKSLDEFLAHWDSQALAGQRSWAVRRDGELGGVVTSTRFNPVAADAHCIFKRSFWGYATTGEALRQVFEEMFEEGVLKIATVAFSDNAAIIGLTGRLGFRREGTLERQTLRDGKLVDQVILGLTKERFDEFMEGTWKSGNQLKDSRTTESPTKAASSESPPAPAKPGPVESSVPGSTMPAISA